MTIPTEVSSPTRAIHAPRCVSTVMGQPASTAHAARAVAQSTTVRQLLRFGLVGTLNTAIDVLALNLLVWLFDLRTTPTLLLANAAAYALGAINSFVFNKRWTFGSRKASTPGEVVRFAFTTLAGIGVNDLLLLLLSKALLPLLGPTQLWANAAKVGAIGGTVLLSYLGMRLWVFAQRMPTTSAVSSPLPSSAVAASRPTSRVWLHEYDWRITLHKVLAHHGLSIVLPAYNEEQTILATVADVVTTLDAWGADFEVLVVDDGSADRTGELIAAYATHDPRVCLVTHATNRGYGAALKSGFAAATRSVDAKLIAYLEAYQGTATYLVATPSSNAADTLILATGKAVMALGGFMGTDPILTSTQLQALVKNGTVRYFLLSGNTRATVSGSDSSTGTSGTVINVGGPNGSQNAAVQWVQQNCKTVPTSEWQSPQSSGTSTTATDARGGSQQLYVCTIK